MANLGTLQAHGQTSRSPCLRCAKSSVLSKVPHSRLLELVLPERTAKFILAAACQKRATGLRVSWLWAGRCSRVHIGELSLWPQPGEGQDPVAREHAGWRGNSESPQLRTWASWQPFMCFPAANLFRALTQRQAKSSLQQPVSVTQQLLRRNRRGSSYLDLFGGESSLWNLSFQVTGRHAVVPGTATVTSPITGSLLPNAIDCAFGARGARTVTCTSGKRWSPRREGRKGRSFTQSRFSGSPLHGPYWLGLSE
jgi:hypothetical protein